MKMKNILPIFAILALIFCVANVDAYQVRFRNYDFMDSTPIDATIAAYDMNGKLVDYKIGQEVYLDLPQGTYDIYAMKANYKSQKSFDNLVVTDDSLKKVIYMARYNKINVTSLTFTPDVATSSTNIGISATYNIAAETNTFDVCSPSDKADAIVMIWSDNNRQIERRMNLSVCTNQQLNDVIVFSPEDLGLTNPGTYNLAFVIGLRTSEGKLSQGTFYKTLTIENGQLFVNVTNMDPVNNKMITATTSFYDINKNRIDFNTGKQLQFLMNPGQYYIKSEAANYMTVQQLDTISKNTLYMVHLEPYNLTINDLVLSNNMPFKNQTVELVLGYNLLSRNNEYNIGDYAKDVTVTATMNGRQITTKTDIVAKNNGFTSVLTFVPETDFGITNNGNNQVLTVSFTINAETYTLTRSAQKTLNIITDLNAPVIGNITIPQGPVTTPFGQVNLTTSENAVCKYSASQNFDFTTGTLFDQTGGTIHSTIINLPNVAGQYTYFIKCQDLSGILSTETNITFVYVPGQDTTAPVWTNINNGDIITLEYNSALRYTFTTTDMSPVFYSINDNINFSMETFTGILINRIVLPVGDYPITLTAVDQSGNANNINIIIRVQDTTAPTFINYFSTMSVPYGTPIYFDYNATDLHTVRYSISTNGSFLINSNTGELVSTSILPIGTYSIIVNAIDFYGNTAAISSTVIVNPSNAPVFTDLIPSVYLFNYGQNVALQFNAVSNSAVRYTINDNTNFAINAQSGLLTNKVRLDVRDYPITVTATDLENDATSISFIIRVSNSNQNGPLSWTNVIPAIINVQYGVPFYYDFNATSNTSITYSVNSALFSMNSATGTLRNATTLTQGDYNIRVTATDLAGNTLFADTIIKVLSTIPNPMDGFVYAKADEVTTQNKAIKMVNVDLSTETPEISENMIMYFTIQNTLSKDMKNVKIRASIPELGITKAVGPFDIDYGKQVSKSIGIEIPRDAISGAEYAIRVTISDSENIRTVYRTIFIK